MENKDIAIEIGIAQIVTEQFAIIPEGYKEKEPMRIQHELRWGADVTNKKIYVQKLARFEHNDNSVFLVIAVACHFAVNPESWHQLQASESEKIILPKVIANHLAMLTVGTLRGVLHSKTENTFFNQFIFPLFDVTTLIPDDVTFEIKDKGLSV